MIKKITKYTAIAVIWIAIWELVSLAVANELLFPSPITVCIALWALLREGDFYLTVGTSILRIIVGTAIGIAIGIVGGILSARFRTAREFFSPMLAIIKSTPVASFIILLVLWLKRDTTPMVICAIMVTPVVWSNVEMGIKKTDRALLEMACVYKMPRGRQISSIYVPSTLPYFISAMRSSLGMAWKAGIAAEVLLQPILSIGKQIFESKYMLETADLFAWTVVVIVLSVIIERVLLSLLAHASLRYSIQCMGGDING